jgi:hypothetical protein
MASPSTSPLVTLSVAKGLLVGSPCHSVPSCHPERSERSRSRGAEMLRCAQHDNPILLSRHRHLKAFRMLSSLLVIPATPHTTLLPSASDRLFARVMPPGRPRGSPLLRQRSALPSTFIVGATLVVAQSRSPIPIAPSQSPCESSHTATPYSSSSS